MASHTIDLQDSLVSVSTSEVRWAPPAGGFICLLGSYGITVSTGNDFYWGLLSLSGAVRVRNYSDQTGTAAVSGRAFTMALEEDGGFIVTVGSYSIQIAIDNLDMTNFYSFKPSNAAEVITFADNVAALSDRSGTSTITDNFSKIYLCSTNINKIYVGSTEVTAAYLGRTKVF